MNKKKIILVIFLYFFTLSSSFSIEADVFVQSTVNRASKILSENGNNSLSSLLEINDPIILEKNKISFTVPSKSNKKEIDSGKENLINFLRAELKNDIIELDVIVDKNISKEYYSTPQEKFEKISKLNPLVDQFKNDLKLDF